MAFAQDLAQLASNAVRRYCGTLEPRLARLPARELLPRYCEIWNDFLVKVCSTTKKKEKKKEGRRKKEEGRRKTERERRRERERNTVEERRNMNLKAKNTNKRTH